MNTPPHPPRSRVLGLVLALVLVALALPGQAVAQSIGDEPPPPAEPDPPVVELVVPVEPSTITLMVPPLPAKKPTAAKPLVRSGAAAATRVASDPTPAPAPSRSYTPEPEPVYSPSPDTEPEPAVASGGARKAKAKPKARAKPRRSPERKPAAARPVEAAVAAVPRPIVDERRMLVSALPASPYAPGEPGPPYLLLLLAIGGSLLLGLAGAAPRLAPRWPDVFVPVARERDVVSFFGLCLLASGVLAWAIVGTGV